MTTPLTLHTSEKRDHTALAGLPDEVRRRMAALDANPETRFPALEVIAAPAAAFTLDHAETIEVLRRHGQRLNITYATI